MRGRLGHDRIARAGREAGTETLGARLRRLAAARGLGLGALADELGVSRQTVSRWANDHHPPPEDDLRDLAAMLDVAPEYLRYGRGPVHPNAVPLLESAEGRALLLEAEALAIRGGADATDLAALRANLRAPDLVAALTGTETPDDTTALAELRDYADAWVTGLLPRRIAARATTLRTGAVSAARAVAARAGGPSAAPAHAAPPPAGPGDDSVSDAPPPAPPRRRASPG